MFEQKLKNEYRNARNITYDIAELHLFIDALDDLVCLVYVSKEWMRNWERSKGGEAKETF